MQELIILRHNLSIKAIVVQEIVERFSVSGFTFVKPQGGMVSC